MIKMISIPRLKLTELQMLSEGTQTIVKDLPEMATFLEAVKTAHEQFLEGIQKDQAASDKETLDKIRDELISGFMLAVKSENSFPYDDTTLLLTVREARKITDKYGMKINRLPYDEQSAQVDNMLGELSKTDLSNVPNLERWVSLIKVANDNFKHAATDFIKEITAASQVNSASAVAPDLLMALENLYTMLFAQAQVTQAEALVQAYMELTTMVDQYR